MGIHRWRVYARHNRRRLQAGGVAPPPPSGGAGPFPGSSPPLVPVGERAQPHSGQRAAVAHVSRPRPEGLWGPLNLICSSKPAFRANISSYSNFSYQQLPRKFELTYYIGMLWREARRHARRRVICHPALRWRLALGDREIVVGEALPMHALSRALLQHEVARSRHWRPPAPRTPSLPPPPVPSGEWPDQSNQRVESRAWVADRTLRCLERIRHTERRLCASHFITCLESAEALVPL